MSIEDEIKKAVNQQKAKALPRLSGWDLMEGLGPFFAVVNLPLAMVATVVGIAGSAMSEGRALSSARMPDDWLEEVANCESLSDKGLVYLACRAEKNGYVTVAEALRFVEIEQEQQRLREAAVQGHRATAGPGASALLSRTGERSSLSRGAALLDEGFTWVGENLKSVLDKGRGC